ncbi:MAG: PP2C family protein-serine/threonine phosphatase, partial [Planctomycetota bacterium]
TRYRPDGYRLLDQVNLTLWTGSAGDQFASAFFGLVDPAQGRIRFSTAGDPAVVLLRPDGWESLSTATPPLGEGPETTYRQHECRLQPGEALLVFTDGIRDALDTQGRPLGEAGLAEPLAAKLQLPAAKLVALARDRLEAHALAPHRYDRTVLVIKPAAP